MSFSAMDRAFAATRTLLFSAFLSTTIVSAAIAPISVPADQWDGIDGSWSSYAIQVGSPPQTIRSFVSFASYQTWVVLPQGCEAAQDYEACAASRGGIFYSNESSTWDQIGIFDLWTDRNLDMFSNAVYGYDKVTLGGYGQGGPTLDNTTVGAMALPVFYFGIFGVNPKPTNFSTFTDGSPSYLSQLKHQNMIPSVSAAYTAGAPYRFDGVLSSLTLGGYDQARFVANDLEFVFGVNNDRETVVGIQSITTPSKTPSSPTAVLLLPNPIYAFIDSTVAQFYLPEEACLAFEAEFGIVYDPDSELYLVNDTLHDSLVQRDANITFTLASALSGGSTIDIVLPYAAFDLTATPPYAGLSESTRYFPLRRATNSTQYTLGRAFLQEAYLSVNWETQRFNVSQVSWVQNAPEQIVAMPSILAQPVDEQQGNGTEYGSKSEGLAPGAIGGIVAAIIVLLLALAGLGFFCIRRPKSTKSAGGHEKLADEPAVQQTTVVFPKVELEGSAPNTGNPFSPTGSSFHDAPDSPRSPVDMFGSQSSRGVETQITAWTISEADSKERVIYEMPGDMPAISEKDSKALTEKEAYAHRQRIYNGVTIPPPPTNLASVLVPAAARLPRAEIDPSNVALVRSGGPYVFDSRTSETQSSGGSDPVSPAMFTQASTHGAEPTLERSPVKTRHYRAFSFEEPISPFAD